MEAHKPTHRKHNPYHDYKERCIYHITLVCSDRDAVLGRIVGDRWETAHCNLSPLGYEVNRAIDRIPLYCKEKGRQVRILAKTVMPDHVHFVLFVEEPMDVALGVVMRGFKQGCNKILKSMLEWNGETPIPPSFIPIRSKRMHEEHALFDPDFDETRLRKRGQLKRIIDYVHSNAQHRWLKRHHPDLLRVIRGIEIAGKSYDAIGNINLLMLSRWQVHVRSKFSENERRNYMNQCVIKARKNYVLVSPFVSPYERQVRDVCLAEGHSIIQLVDNGFSDYTNMRGDLYDYTLTGQVLLLVPSEYPHIARKPTISRSECTILNARSEEIVNE